jgi:hypothetical protein
MVDIRQPVTKAMWEALEAKGTVLGLTQGAANVAFGGEILIDSITFTHKTGYYEETRFTSTYNLNATGATTMRFRYVSGVGPVTTAGTLEYTTIADGNTSNKTMTIEHVMKSAFRSLGSGVYTLGVFAQAGAGAASGTMLGPAGGADRDFVVKSWGPA